MTIRDPSLNGEGGDTTGFLGTASRARENSPTNTEYRPGTDGATLDTPADNPLTDGRGLSSPSAPRSSRAGRLTPTSEEEVDRAGGMPTLDLDLSATQEEPKPPLRKEVLRWVKHLREAGRLESQLDRRIERAVKTLQNRQDARAVSIGIHSPKGGVGKSYLLKLLSHWLTAYQGLSVCVLDANMDDSNLSETLGQRNPRTIADVLEHRTAIRRGGIRPLYSFATVKGDVPYFVSPDRPGQRARMDVLGMTHTLDTLTRQFSVVFVDNSISVRDPITHWAMQSVDHLCWVGSPELSVMRKVVSQVLYITGRTPVDRYEQDHADKLDAIAEAWRSSGRAEEDLPITPPGLRDHRDVSVLFNKSGELGRDPVSIEKVRAAVEPVNAVETFGYSKRTAGMVQRGDMVLDEMPESDRLSAKKSLAAILERVAGRKEGE